MIAGFRTTAEYRAASLGNTAPTAEQTGQQLFMSPIYQSSVGVLPIFQSGVSAHAYRRIRELRRDPTIALARWLCCAPIIATEWTIETTANAPEGAKEFIDEVMQAWRFEILNKATYGLIDFGWICFEKVFELNADGKYVPKKLKPLLHDITFILCDMENGDFSGVRNGGIHDLTADDVLHLALEVEGTNWYGQSVMVNLIVSQDKYDKASESAERFDSKIAGSHLVVEYPPGNGKLNGNSVPNEEIAAEVVKRWQSSGATVIPSGLLDWVDEQNNSLDAGAARWKISLLETAAAAADFVTRLDYLDKCKVRGLGIPERAVIEGNYGTKADAEAHGDFAIVNIELRHLQIVQGCNKGLVNQLLTLNYGGQFVDTVKIKPAPLTDTRRAFLQQIFTQMLQNPEVSLLETRNIDWKSIQDAIGLPVNEDVADELLPVQIPQTDSGDTPLPTEPVQLAFDESKIKRDKDGEFATKGGKSKGGKTQAPIEKKGNSISELAKKHYNPSTAEKQRLADDYEIKLAKTLGAKRSGGNKPMDLYLDPKEKFGIELKTLHNGSQNRVQMRKDSRERKESWLSEQRGRKAVTVAIDNRDKFQGGKHKDNYSGHKVYYQEGVGAYRLGSMKKAKSLSHLKEILLGLLK
jgi:hypothetical protein